MYWLERKFWLCVLEFESYAGLTLTDKSHARRLLQVGDWYRDEFKKKTGGDLYPLLEKIGDPLLYR